MSKRQTAKSVREPVQVYLAEADVTMLNMVVGQTGWTKAEVLRRGVRSIAAETLGDQGPAMRFLASAAEIDMEGPSDAALHHDEFLAGSELERWNKKPAATKRGATPGKRRA